MKGFTLIELLIVLAMIGILAAIIIPAFKGYVKQAHENQRIELQFEAEKVRPIEKYNKICNDKECYEVK